jgi:hypothetical protein
MQKLLPECVFGFLVLLSFQVSVASVSGDKWLHLGEGKAMPGSTDAYIPADASKGTMCAIRLNIQGRGIELDEMTVHFGNSQRMHVSTLYIIPDNSSSPSIPLPGIRRTVNGIDIVYRLLDPKAAGPTVNLWGNALPGVVSCVK